jgi:hypothetical protein
MLWFCVLLQVDAYLEHLQQEFDQLETGHSSQSAASPGRLMHGEASRATRADKYGLQQLAFAWKAAYCLLLAEQSVVHLQCTCTTDMQA